MTASLYQSGSSRRSAAGRRAGLVIMHRRRHRCRRRRGRVRRSRASCAQALCDARASSAPGARRHRQLPLGGARAVHARLAPEPEDVLHRDDGTFARRDISEAGSCPSGCRGSPSGPARGTRARAARARLSVCAGCGVPLPGSWNQPDGRVVVVRAGVDDGVARVVVRARSRRLRIGAERELQDAMPGRPKSSRSALHLGRDGPEVLGDERQRAAELVPRRASKSAAPGPLHPAPVHRGRLVPPGSPSSARSR